MDGLLFDVGFGILVFLAAVYALKMLRQAMVTNIVSVSKETDHGEHLQLNANFHLWDTAASKQKKLDEICQLGEDRRMSIQERYQALIKEQGAEKSS